MHIRPATDDDIDALLAIHNEAILNSAAIWMDEPVERAEREAWLADHHSVGHPVIVADIDGKAVGYASYSQWKARSGYRHTVENSLYIDVDHRGQGIGRLLMVELIAQARATGLHVMMSGIEGGNAASLHLHESLGFERVGFVPEVGTKFGRWLDLVLLRLPLVDARP